jgi:hypothetical protein
LLTRPARSIRLVRAQTESWLDRSVELTTEDGETVSRDLIETYVPLTSADGDSPVLVFHLARDITDTLESNIVFTQTMIRNTTLIMPGVLLTILALLVFGLDLRISKRNRAVISNGHMIREELNTQNTELHRVDDAKPSFLANCPTS